MDKGTGAKNWQNNVIKQSEIKHNTIVDTKSKKDSEREIVSDE